MQQYFAPVMAERSFRPN